MGTHKDGREMAWESIKSKTKEFINLLANDRMLIGSFLSCIPSNFGSTEAHEDFKKFVVDNADLLKGLNRKIQQVNETIFNNFLFIQRSSNHLLNYFEEQMKYFHQVMSKTTVYRTAEELEQLINEHFSPKDKKKKE